MSRHLRSEYPISREQKLFKNLFEELSIEICSNLHGLERLLNVETTVDLIVLKDDLQAVKKNTRRSLKILNT